MTLTTGQMDRRSPELIVSGHTKSWEAGQPGLLTQCEDHDGNPIDVYGPIDPTEQSSYDFLSLFFDEITRWVTSVRSSVTRYLNNK